MSEMEIPLFLVRDPAEKARRMAEASTEPVRTGHAPKSPSASHRWMPCPGSVNLVKTMPNESSPESRLGTAAHDLAARLLVSDTVDAWEHIGTAIKVEGESFTVDKEMADAVQIYLDEIRGAKPSKRLVEVQFDLDDLAPGVWGTADCAAWFVEDGVRILRIYDYKHGKGIAVDADENPQLMIYAAGAIHKLSGMWGTPDIVELVIVQPRAHHPLGAVRKWRTTADALGEWVNTTLIPKAAACDAPDAPLASGEWCRKSFCPAAKGGRCPVLRAGFAAAVDAQREVYGDIEKAEAAGQTITMPELLATLSDNELGTMYERADDVRSFFEALEEEIWTRLQKGIKVPGTKVVHKQTARVFKPGVELALIDALGVDAPIYTEPKLLGITALEKLPGAKPVIAQYAYTPDAGLTWAKESDRRPAVTVRTAAEAFAKIGN